ncbi:hypothetical protein BECAL_02891 [Bellilinea caldifistulae]|nr:hypothetical protein [Bellilinea caldifistulae]GAP11700.1 hypothetical protein BECAL_02891 [Bellilinea caldifistulae]
MMKKSSQWIATLSAFLIPLLVIAGYYVTHKPFDLSFALAFTLIIWRLLLAGWILSLAGGLGAHLLHRLPLHPLAALTVQATAGLGLLALIILLTGALIGTALGWMAVLMIGLSFLLRRSIRVWLLEWKAWREVIQASSPAERWIGVLIGIALSASLWTALAPPVKYDALVYHLTLPQAYLAAGKITHVSWLMMSGYPQNAEMLYLLAMALGGASAAPVLGWGFALLGLAGLLGWLVEAWGSRAAWTACAALFAGSTLVLSSGWGYVDWLGLLFGLGCLISLDIWQKEVRQRRYLMLAGAFSGMAIGTKYPFGMLALVGLVVIGFLFRRSLRQIFRHSLIFSLGVFLFVLPWLAKNYLFTGNPVYPFFFPAADMDEIRIAIYFEDEPYGDWRDVFLLPLRATIWGVEGGPGYGASIGPLLLGFGLLAGLNWHKGNEPQRQILQLTAVFVLATWFFWALGGRYTAYFLQTRMFYPMLPAFAALAGIGFLAASSVQIGSIRLQRVLTAMVIMVLAFTALEVQLDLLRRFTPQAALGLLETEKYLERNTGWYQPAMEAVRSLPEDSHTLLIYEPRAFYCRPVCTPDENLDRWRRDWTRNRDFNAIRQQWQQEGFTHLLVFRSGVQFMKENPDPKHPMASLTALEEFLTTLPVVEDFGEVYQLYLLK